VIQQIPLDGGLVTQVDPEEVGISACTELINAEFDKPGLIYKRKGSATGVDTNKTFISIFRWVNPYFTSSITWIGLDSNGEIWSSYNLTTWTSQTDLNIADARIYNHGTFLRVAGGTTVQPRIIQDIDRSFFHDGTSFLFAYDNLHVGLPPKYPTTFEIDTDATKTKINLGGGGTLPFSNDAKSCFYKFTPVFDGNQELPFSDNYHAFGIAVQDPVASNSNVQLRLKLDEDDFDPRITSINMYRAITDGMVPDNSLYRKIDSFLLTESTVQHWISGNASTGRKVFSGGTTLTDVTTTALGNHKLYWNATSVAELNKLSVLNGDAGLTINSAYNRYVFLNTDFEAANHWGATRYWQIRDNDNLILNGDFETNTSNWIVDGTLSRTNTLDSNWADTIPSGSYVAKLDINISGSGGAEVASITQDDTDVVIGRKYLFTTECKFRKVLQGTQSSIGCQCKLQYYEGGSYTTFATFTCANNADFVTVSGTFTPTTDSVKLRVTIYNPNTPYSMVDDWVYLDSIQVYPIIADGTVVYSGEDVFAVNSSGISSGAGVNNIARISGDDYIVTENLEDVFKVHTTSLASGGSSASTAVSSAGDQWTQGSSNVVYLDTYDTGLTDGAYHPIASTSSTEVNYKYSVTTDGRQFVAGIKLDPNGDQPEDHNNWVIFSELNQYDILPISNYIQLRDLQGGAITGLSSLMGDLVVFMERGIYRLSVPSVDPTAWSLSESEENIGCIVDTSITSWESGVFFAGKDHLYFLDANFKAHPMTASIKDDYQSAVTSTARTFYDVKKNRLLCRFGADGATIYSLDLSSFPEERWSQITTGSGDMDLFTVNEDLALYSYDEVTQYIKLHDNSKSESTSFKRTTGWISQANIDRSGVLRRLNLKYSSGDAITAKIYIDGDDSTVISTITIPADTSGADWYKCKPNVRCRSYKIELTTASSVNDVEIRRLEVEFE